MHPEVICLTSSAFLGSCCSIKCDPAVFCPSGQPSGATCSQRSDGMTRQQLTSAVKSHVAHQQEPAALSGRVLWVLPQPWLLQYSLKHMGRVHSCPPSSLNSLYFWFSFFRGKKCAPLQAQQRRTYDHKRIKLLFLGRSARQLFTVYFNTWVGDAFPQGALHGGCSQSNLCCEHLE